VRPPGFEPETAMDGDIPRKLPLFLLSENPKHLTLMPKLNTKTGVSFITFLGYASLMQYQQLVFQLKNTSGWY
jgi:hypothetical protein